MKKVLFLTEKWCDGNPEMGLTNHYHNLFGSLKCTGLADVKVAHYDEIMYNSKTHFDLHAKRILSEHTPEIVVVSHLGQSYLNPSLKTYKEIRRRGIKLVFIWPDTREWIPDAINSLYDVANLQVSWGCEKPDDQPINNNHVWLWCPQDETIYFDDTKTVGASFMGSLNGYNNIRRNAINYLIQSGVPINVNGGQREKKLDFNEYAKLVRTAKINLNFSESAYPGIQQCKGRVIEIIGCNSLLLESQNEATKRRLTPNTHYIEFTSPNDLKDKVEYFLRNDRERQQIAQAGHECYKQKYSATVYWNTVFERL